jgi:hypothetical protein
MISSRCHLVVGQRRDEGQENGEASNIRHKNVPPFHPDDELIGH